MALRALLSICLLASPLSSDHWIGKFQPGLQGIVIVPKSPFVLHTDEYTDDWTTVRVCAVYSDGSVVDISTSPGLSIVPSGPINEEDPNGIKWHDGILEFARINARVSFPIHKLIDFVSPERKIANPVFA